MSLYLILWYFQIIESNILFCKWLDIKTTKFILKFGIKIKWWAPCCSRLHQTRRRTKWIVHAQLLDVHSPAREYIFSVWTVIADRSSLDSWINGVSCRLRTCRAGTARKSQPFCKCSSYRDLKKKWVVHAILFIPSTILLFRGGDSTTPPFAALFFSFWRRNRFANAVKLLLTVVCYLLLLLSIATECTTCIIAHNIMYILQVCTNQ